MTDFEEIRHEEMLGELKSLNKKLSTNSNGVAAEMLKHIESIRGENGDDGVGIKDIHVNDLGGSFELSVYLSDGTIKNHIIETIKGDKGDAGNDGLSATVRLGNVTVGDKANVTNVGTERDVVLDIVIPKAIEGEQGIQGDPGKDGTDGKDGQGFTYKGAFDINKTYQPYDVVESDGSSYVAKVSVSANGVYPTESSQQWGLLAKKGRDGISRGGGTWAIPAGGSGITRSIVSTSGNVTAGTTASTDYVYIISGAHTVTLPTAVGNTNKYTLKNAHSSPVTLAFTSGQTADGAGITLGVNESVDLISDNTNWRII